jgi:TrmH family RNA methyltransferase
LTRRLFIASSTNPRLKALRRLAQRRSPELCLAEGARAVGAALDAGTTVVELYVAPALFAGERDELLLRRAERSGVPMVELDAGAFRVVAQARPDGFLAVVRRPAVALSALHVPADPVLLVAVGIERPGNLGTIVRTACATGVDALLVVDAAADVFHPETIRGSLGLVFALPCAVARSAPALAWLQTRGLRIIVTSPRAETPHWHADYDGDLDRGRLRAPRPAAGVARRRRRPRRHPDGGACRQPQRGGRDGSRAVRGGSAPR